LVVTVAPDVSVVLFGFLCAKVSLGCEESTSEESAGQVWEVFLERFEHWFAVRVVMKLVLDKRGIRKVLMNGRFKDIN
jgi:hypothetical protein